MGFRLDQQESKHTKHRHTRRHTVRQRKGYEGKRNHRQTRKMGCEDDEDCGFMETMIGMGKSCGCIERSKHER
jgi:hypothetical protein